MPTTRYAAGGVNRLSQRSLIGILSLLALVAAATILKVSGVLFTPPTVSDIYLDNHVPPPTGDTYVRGDRIRERWTRLVGPWMGYCRVHLVRCQPTLLVEMIRRR